MAIYLFPRLVSLSVRLFSSIDQRTRYARVTYPQAGKVQWIGRGVHHKTFCVNLRNLWFPAFLFGKFNYAFC